LSEKGEKFELLLELIDAVEDVETLTVMNQAEVSLKLLAFRDHLREILASPLYAAFKAGKEDWRVVLKAVSGHIQSDLSLTYDFETLPPPRDLTSLENYLQRAEWQYYKTATRDQDFSALVSFAQHDARYLRAVSRTSKKLHDLNVENHNLPMVLLFREALRIKGVLAVMSLVGYHKGLTFPVVSSADMIANLIRYVPCNHCRCFDTAVDGSIAAVSHSARTE
jgi:hypothetical protein